MDQKNGHGPKKKDMDQKIPKWTKKMDMDQKKEDMDHFLVHAFGANSQ